MDLVTGGGGYLGSHVVSALLERGRHVRILDVQKTQYCPSGAEFVQGDMSRADDVRSAMSGIERVIHIAFVQSMSRRPESERYRINIDGMSNLLDAAHSQGVKRFVFTSTIEIYGVRPPFPCLEDAPKDEPVGWYGRHKWICEQMLWDFSRKTGLPAVALRMPTICGRGFYNHRPLLKLMDRILDNKTVAVIGSGSIPGDFVLLEDVVQGFMLAVEHPNAAGESFNISGKGASSQSEVIHAMIQAVGSSSRIVRIPLWLARSGIRLLRGLGVHDLPPDQDGYLFNPNHYSVEKARRMIGYEPRATPAEAAAALITGYVQDREYVRKRSENY